LEGGLGGASDLGTSAERSGGAAVGGAAGLSGAAAGLAGAVARVDGAVARTAVSGATAPRADSERAGEVARTTARRAGSSIGACAGGNSATSIIGGASRLGNSTRIPATVCQAEK
jgi:hypothetical protein